MKKVLILLMVSILGILSYWGLVRYQFTDVVVADIEQQKQRANEDLIMEGDIIFQASLSSQSKAIQLATGSKYSHVGIIYKNKGKYYVYEAIQPIVNTPLQKWIDRGEKGHYAIKRLKNADAILTTETLSRMKQYGSKFLGRDYDLYFEWTDERLYCSELVWKIYKNATGIEIGKLSKLSDFDLSNELVKKKLKERYGSNIPMNEEVISPGAMFESNKLVLVKKN